MYPIILHLEGKLAVVVGGGAVGRRKAEGLLRAGASVRVIDPGGAAGLDGAEVLSERFRPEHLDGAALVYACTNDAQLNEHVAADAKIRGAWVCVADNPALGDFTLPAVHRGEGIILAVGTSGGAPATAALVRDALAQAIPADADRFAAALGAVREAIKRNCPAGERRTEVLRTVCGPDGLAAFQRGGAEALEALIEELQEPDEPRMDGG